MSAGESYNGWPANSDPAAIGVNQKFAVNGVQFPGGVKGGDIETVFTYLVTQLDTIEPLVPGWCWGYGYRANVNNPSTLSCHSSATAVDYNAPDHPNGYSKYAGWTDTQVNAIRTVLGYLEGTVQWGADFSHTKDAMHFEARGTTSDIKRVADKIRNQKPPQEDDVTPDECRQVVQQELTNFFRTQKFIVTNDRASTPNDVPYSFETAVERLIRLTSGTFVGETGKPHND